MGMELQGLVRVEEPIEMRTQDNGSAFRDNTPSSVIKLTMASDFFWPIAAHLRFVQFHLSHSFTT